MQKIYQEITNLRCTQTHSGFLQNLGLLVLVHTVSGKLTQHRFVKSSVAIRKLGKVAIGKAESQTVTIGSISSYRH